MRILFILYFAFSLSFLHAVEPPGFIIGRVSEIETGEPLAGANIIFRRTQGTVTNNTGNFIIQAEPGSLSFTVQFVGYKSVTRSVNVRAGDTLQLNIYMEPDITEIDQVVVSASRIEQRIAELTVSVSVIRPWVISSNHFTITQELLNKSPGIEVLDGQASIRGGSGFSYGAGSRVLALIDGLPILSADAGNIKWNSLPLENIAQVEIIKGASSVLYGSSALNGVINFRSALAGNKPLTNVFLESGIFGKPQQENWVWWNTPRMFNSASVSHLQKFGNTDIGFGGFFQTDNGYRRLNDEKFGRANLRVKHHNQRVKGLTYGINFNGYLTRKRDFILWENAETGALKQDESLAILLNGSFFAFDPFISLEKSDRLQHDLKSRFQITENKFPESAQNNSTALSMLAEYQSYFKLTDKLSLNAGLYGYGSNIISNFYGNHRALNLAVFTQADMALSNRLKIVAGMRLEYNSLNDVRDDIMPLFRGGLNFRAFDRTFIRASFGQGYRFPSIAEKHAATTLASVVIIPNALLLPESGWNSEIGIKHGIMTPSMNGLIDLALFYTQNINLIEYVFGFYAGQTGFRAENIEDSRVYGLELELMLNNSFGRLNYTINGGYLFTIPVEFDRVTGQGSGDYLKFRRKHSAKVHFTSSYKKYEFGIGLFVKSRILNIDNVFLNSATRELILPGFYNYWLENNTGHFLIDANIGYKLSENYRISLVVKNLTNTEYMGRPGDIQPHRNFSIRLSGSF